MRKFKLYLDTSVLNFLYADDVPEFKKVTEDFFENYVKKGKYIVYISDVVIREIEKTKDKNRKIKLLELIKGYFYPLVLTNPMEVIYEND